jgi:hypothetical protein
MVEAGVQGCMTRLHMDTIIQFVPVVVDPPVKGTTTETKSVLF